ncbi:MAG: hypothetical protein EA427_00935 [Spirochaetaceae bacterium]|nr:MAG: hypothetical protein EA427_00935 [Spirochaetaceae bacterium]
MVNDPNVFRYILPPRRIVRRARDWRLYDDAGNRYADFWQADGAAFLGHRPRGLARTVAAEIDRGLWAPLPAAWEGRLEKALVALALRAGVPALTLDAAPCRWRPLEESEIPCTGTARVVLPFPLVTAPPAPTAPATPLAPSAPPAPGSPVLLSGLVVAAGLLLRYLDSPEARMRLELASTLPAPPGYRRSGVYWLPDATPAGATPADATPTDVPPYERVRERALGLGLILPPRAGDPICCPGELGRKERVNWEAFCADGSE